MVRLQLIVLRFPHLIILPNVMTKKGKGYLEQLKNLSTKMQELISIIVITEKSEKLCQITGIPGT